MADAWFAGVGACAGAGHASLYGVCECVRGGCDDDDDDDDDDCDDDDDDVVLVVIRVSLCCK